jgi:serine acetyltransferase
VIVGAGAVVLRNVIGHTTVIGVPAKVAPHDRLSKISIWYRYLEKLKSSHMAHTLRP